MKVKKKKDMMIPMYDSYKGLSFNDWEKLNDGQAVELKEIPELVKPYLENMDKGKDKKNGS
tara:strand:- start:313 stop:495 length:183 start_codon:yes stop_codon:yes gene_type:complete